MVEKILRIKAGELQTIRIRQADGTTLEVPTAQGSQHVTGLRVSTSDTLKALSDALIAAAKDGDFEFVIAIDD